MALYGPALKKLIPPGPTDPRITARVLIYHVAVSEQPSLYAYFNGPSGGVESHFYIRRDGTVEQYRDTAYQADANTDANGFAISVETQGMAAGEWTPEQVAALKALTLWCHKVHGIPLVKCATWNGAGVGYHTLFPGTWDKRGASCPGPDRIRQFNNTIVPWLAAPTEEEDPMSGITIEDIEKAAARGVLSAKLGSSGPTVAVAMQRTYGAAVALTDPDRVEELAERVVAKLGGSADAASVKQAVKDALREGVQS